MRCIETIVTYALPEFMDVVQLTEKYEVRFDIVWIQKKVLDTVDTPVIELCYEANKAGVSIFKPLWKRYRRTN